MPLLATRASCQFQAAARRIEGCSWHSLKARVPRLPSAIPRRSSSVLSCSAPEEALVVHQESSWLSSDASTCDLSVTDERLSEGHRRVQRLVELAEMDTLGGRIQGDNDDSLLAICQCRHDTSSCSPASGHASQDSAPSKSLGGGEQSQQAVNVLGCEGVAHGGCDLSHDSLSSSTHIALERDM